MTKRHLWIGLALLLTAGALVSVVKKRFLGSEESTGETLRKDSGSLSSPSDVPDNKLRSSRFRREAAAGKEPSYLEPGSYEHALRDVLQPFNQEELVLLASTPEKEPYRLTKLIHRAAAEKDLRFRYLVDQKNLREEPAMDLAVSAYDYAVNGNEEALNHILEIHSRQASGSDSDSLVTLSYIDEWDRTIDAYHEHFANGARGEIAGLARDAFLVRREYLFPYTYRKFKKDAEQGMRDDAR